MNPCYPLYLDLDDRSVVVIGAGVVAERKIVGVLRYGARVRVIAPQAVPAIEEMAGKGALVWERRPYRPGDLVDATLVFSATGVSEVDRAVFDEAQDNNQPINVVDVPTLCSFIVPSIVRRGLLQIAISTSGAAPTVAKQIRHELSERYDDSWGDVVELLGAVRPLIRQRVLGDEARRKPLFEALAHAELRERLVAGERLTPEQVYDEIVTPLLRDKGDDSL
jgi:precorrin-2 dehydrogenase/sirohydrochlorin ferrochelatase